MWGAEMLGKGCEGVINKALPKLGKLSKSLSSTSTIKEVTTTDTRHPNAVPCTCL